MRALAQARARRFSDDALAIIVLAVVSALAVIGDIASTYPNWWEYTPWTAAIAAAMLADVFTIGLRTDRFVPVIGSAATAGSTVTAFYTRGAAAAVGVYLLMVCYSAVWMYVYLWLANRFWRQRTR